MRINMLDGSLSVLLLLLNAETSRLRLMLKKWFLHLLLQSFKILQPYQAAVKAS